MDKQHNSELMDALATAFAKNKVLCGVYLADVDDYVNVVVIPDDSAFVKLNGSFSLRELACIVSYMNSTL